MKNSKALLTVFVVVFVDLLGFGIVLPLLPFYGSRFGASPTAVGLLFSVYSFAQLIFSPIWGALSDRVGRRPIMLLSTLGSFLAYLLFAFSDSFGVLFLSRILAGIMGGNISAAQAYISDVTTHEDRARGMGLLGAAFGIGFTLGPALAAALTNPFFYGVVSKLGFESMSLVFSESPYLAPGIMAAGLSACSFLLVKFCLPETVSKGREAIRSRSVFSKSFWQGVLNPEQGSQLTALLLCSLLLAFGQSALYSAFPLFCQANLGFSPSDVGMQFGAMGLIAVVIQGGLIRRLEKAFGEVQLFIVGSVLLCLAFILLPFAKNAGQLLAFLTLLAIGSSFSGPTLNSLISKMAPPDRIGALMGTSQGLSAMGRAMGPTWGGFLFGFSYRLPFVSTALVLVFVILTGLRLKKA